MIWCLMLSGEMEVYQFAQIWWILQTKFDNATLKKYFVVTVSITRTKEE